MVLDSTPQRDRRRRDDPQDLLREDVRQQSTSQLNVAIPQDVHQRIRLLAVQEGISIKDWGNRAVMHYLNCDQVDPNP